MQNAGIALNQQVTCYRIVYSNVYHIFATNAMSNIREIAVYYQSPVPEE